MVDVTVHRAATQIRADGRVTLPADMRRDLGLEKGDYVIVDVRPLEGATDHD